MEEISLAGEQHDVLQDSMFHKNHSSKELSQSQNESSHMIQDHVTGT